MSIKPIDVIAIILIVGCLYLISTGVDGEVKLLLGTVVGYYFRQGVEACGG